LPALPSLSKHVPLLSGLALTRVIGWGSTYYAPSVLVGTVDPALGLSAPIIFGGITVLLITGAFLGPAIGRQIDRNGTRGMMCLGAVVIALGLALTAAAQGPLSYLASWIVIGLGHAMSLGNTGNVTIAQVTGRHARRVIGLIMLATGLASSVFWPLAAALCEAYGWRTTWLIFAAMQLCIVIPIYACIPRYRKPQREAEQAETADGTEHGTAPPNSRKTIFWLVALIFSASGLVSWGLPLILIPLIERGGLDHATAVWIASLSGPATLLARAVDAVAGEKFPVERVALIGLALGPLASLVLAFGPRGIATPVIAVVTFAGAMGVISVARATLPLMLFGRNGYGAMLGNLNLPQNLTFAAAPLLFAMMMEKLGSMPTLVVSAAIQMVGFVALLALIRLLAGPARAAAPAE
jgi:predicted MFS family arabinose efflux permease